MNLLTGGLIATAIASVLAFQAAAGAGSCEGLKNLKLTNTTITTAEPVEAGHFTLPASTPPSPAAAAFATLPAFCRITATIKPSSDSDIKIDVWMPASGWNGKLEAAGNGGRARPPKPVGRPAAVKARNCPSPPP